MFIINYDIFSKNCIKTCKYHDEFVEKIVSIMSTRMIELTNHIELLTKKTIREKLLSYFTSISYQKSSRTFRIPLSLTALDSYLNIDRSAMMREMKYLQEEHFLKKDKNKITLL